MPFMSSDCVLCSYSLLAKLLAGKNVYEITQICVEWNVTLSLSQYFSSDYLDRLKWRHSNVWSRYDLQVVGHDVVLWKANWCRSVT